MNTFTKKIIVLVSSIVLLASMLVPAFADEGCDHGWKSDNIVHEFRQI